MLFFAGAPTPVYYAVPLLILVALREFPLQEKRYKIDPLDRPMGAENVLIMRSKVAAITTVPNVKVSLAALIIRTILPLVASVYRRASCTYVRHSGPHTPA